MRRQSIVCVTTGIVLALYTAVAMAEAGSYVANEVITNEVTFPDGIRRDDTSTECIVSPTGRLFEQASFMPKILSHRNDDERTCTLTFSDYQDYVPGIKEPRKACLVSFVKSVGGVVNAGKQGHLQCAMDYRIHDAPPLQQNIDMQGDARAVIVGLPADLSMEREKRSLVTVSVPLKTLQFGIDQSLRDKQGLNLPGFTVTVMDSGFRDYAPGRLVFHYYVDVDVSSPLLGARCAIDARFSIPPASPDKLLIQEAGTTVDCKSGSLIGQLANLPQEMNSAIRGAITSKINKQLGGGDTFKDWAADDPDLAQVVRQSLIQGSYCPWRNEPGLCVAIGWPHLDAISAWETSLLSKVPKGNGPIDTLKAKNKLSYFEKLAQEKHQVVAGGVKYPSGITDKGAPEDGDMSIFGGLLCRSGSPDGCNLIKHVNTPDGRFWRSPGRIGEPEKKDHATFSGDQLKGVFHYLTVTKDTARLKGFLNYLKTKPTPVPDISVPLESGYSSCPNFGPNFTCLLGGPDWYLLKLLANKLGATNALPSDLPGIEHRYGFSYDALVWEALMTNSGYRMHLVANNAWLLRTLGEKDPRLDKVVKLIAARQPSNPFFLYLLLGPDKKVQELTDQKCLDPTTRKDYSDWAWQRAESQKAWEHSMVWDCVFMYGLLTRDPLPLSP